MPINNLKCIKHFKSVCMLIDDISNSDNFNYLV